ncbi:hypothetical protein [Noviherbaspirillum sedimenti]|uniref:Uncharacterized protein n=1 Tax=Noviherbaspirillum sedimenti TaxID=2320865 RepID=A0A3A3G9I7_9BURK|nr:hypothetical protein [Noviherbaspirillum sedimenti]RJG03242.1 hypothetical protein D3878_17955 [Noviherbaspirillum sedimenti]
MARLHIRQLKREAYSRNDSDAMLALLNRSVRFGHKRLALMRCIQAEQMGLAVLPDILSYCREIADQMPGEVLAKLIHQAGTQRAQK